MYNPVRGGTRGGQGDFKWSDVAADKDRENYLGHSLNAPVGRWQNNKDLTWYNKDGGSTNSARADEIRKIKEAEEDALSIALGFAPAPRAPPPPPIDHNEAVLAEAAAKARRKEERRREKEERHAERERKRFERSQRRDRSDHPPPRGSDRAETNSRDRTASTASRNHETWAGPERRTYHEDQRHRSPPQSRYQAQEDRNMYRPSRSQDNDHIRHRDHRDRSRSPVRC